MQNNQNEIILYQPDNSIQLEVRFENETVWLNRQQMSVLFDRDIKTIGKHVNNALKEELAGFSTVANFATVQLEGNREVLRNIEYYNLDMILSVGYRVKSSRGIQFRIWANRVLKEYLLKGIVVNQRIDRLERKIVEHDHKFDLLLRTPQQQNESLLHNEILQLKHYIEGVLADYNDINEDTRMQLEMINKELADLHVKNNWIDKSRNPIGFKY